MASVRLAASGDLAAEPGPQDQRFHRRDRSLLAQLPAAGDLDDGGVDRRELGAEEGELLGTAVGAWVSGRNFIPRKL